MGAIMEKKMVTPTEVLCKGMPQEFATFLDYTRNLQFDEQPDYRYLYWLLQNLFRSQKFENDGCFDWTLVKARPGWQVTELRQAREQRELEQRAHEQQALSATAPSDRANPQDVVLSVRSDP